MEISQKVQERLKKIDTYTLKQLLHQMLIDEDKFKKDLAEISYELKRRDSAKQNK